MTTAYDVWKFFDYADDSIKQAQLEYSASQIRKEMNPSDFIQEIECDASFDVECCKAIQLMFLGGDPATCAKVLTKFADKWLDRQAMKLAQQYSK